MTVVDSATVALLGVGAFFFVAGTVGLLRFPDTLSRLHALTKADNVGLGFVVAALALQASTVAAALKLVLIWVLALVASSTSAFLIARWSMGAVPAGASSRETAPDSGAQRSADDTR